jgi:hypothetical protein
MIINNVVPCTWTHLTDTHTDWVDMSPTSLWVFIIHVHRQFEIVERKLCLTFLAVTIYMELWDNMDHLLKEEAGDVHPDWKLMLAFAKISEILTYDVI